MTQNNASNESQVLDVMEICRYLPHRYPFLLVDRVLAIKPGESITCLKNLTINELFFQGHVPGYPLMPGVLMIEALAQASGILVYRSENALPDDEKSVHYLAGVDHARFKRVVSPGDQLKLDVKILHQRRNLWKFEGIASVEGATACKASFMTVRQEKE